MMRQRFGGPWSWVVVTIIVATACSPAGPAPSSPATAAAATAAAATAAATPRQGGTLRVGVETDLRESDNLQARNSFDKLMVGSTVYDPLFASNEKGEPQPALAKTATSSSDLLAWTLTLQQGVKFSNGKAFTAKDVKDNFDAFLDPANASGLRVDLGNISKVDVLDTFTVRITLKSPEAAFPAALQESVYMADIDARKSMGVDAWKQNPIGTGPYKWLSRVPGDNITFVRNDTYWRGVPPLDKVIFKPYLDLNVAALALQRGEVDVLATNTVALNALPNLRANSDVRVYGADSNAFYTALLNFEKARRGGYKDPLAFRQGLAMLFNAREMIPRIVGDGGTYAPQPIPPFQTGHDPNLTEIRYDPTRGKSLLAQAGYPAGSTIKFLVNQFGFSCPWATALQSSLQQEGFKVDLQCVRGEVLPPLVRQYDWDALFFQASGRVTAARFFRDRFQKSNAAIPDDFWTIRNDTLEGYIIDMLATKVDDPKYAALGHQISRLLIQDEAAAIGGYWGKTWWAASKKVRGLVLSPLGYYGFLMNAMTTVWVEQ